MIGVEDVDRVELGTPAYCVAGRHALATPDAVKTTLNDLAERCRGIMMTALPFLLGIVALIVATGAGPSTRGTGADAGGLRIPGTEEPAPGGGARKTIGQPQSPKLKFGVRF